MLDSAAWPRIALARAARARRTAAGDPAAKSAYRG